MEKILIVDFLNVAFRGMYIHSNMTYHNEKVGGLYGFCNILFSNILKHKPNAVIFAKDGKKTHTPTGLNLLYKANRSNSIDKDYFYTSLSLINEFIAKSKIGLSIQENDTEADDIIKWLCSRLIQHNIVILSNDSDLYYLLKYKNVCIQTTKNLITDKEYRQLYGFSPELHNHYLALSGGHNNLPHPTGVGHKTAIKLVQDGLKSGDIENYLLNNCKEYDVFKRTFDFIARPIVINIDILNLLSNTVCNKFDGEDYLISKCVRLSTTQKAFDILDKK